MNPRKYFSALGIEPFKIISMLILLEKVNVLILENIVWINAWKIKRISQYLKIFSYSRCNYFNFFYLIQNILWNIIFTLFKLFSNHFLSGTFIYCSRNIFFLSNDSFQTKLSSTVCVGTLSKGINWEHVVTLKIKLMSDSSLKEFSDAFLRKSHRKLKEKRGKIMSTKGKCGEMSRHSHSHTHTTARSDHPREEVLFSLISFYFITRLEKKIQFRLNL